MKSFKIFIALATIGFAACQPAPPPPRQPDIIIISIDTLRADHLGCYGYSRPTSPAIDAFSRECALFRNALSPAHYTAPAHMSIFTALTPFVHGVNNRSAAEQGIASLPPGIPSLVEDLHRAGYLTVGLHGGANVDDQFGFGRGFDYYAPDFYQWRHGQAADPEAFGQILGSIRSWLRRGRSEGKPVFLFLHHYLCHAPYLSAPPPFRFHFVPDIPDGLPRSLEDLPPPDEPQVLRTAWWNVVDLSRPAHREYAVGLYDGAILYSDAIAKRLFDLFRKEGIYDRAIIALLSDHGEEFFEHGGHGHENLFIENIHVPLLIKFPQGRWAGTTWDRRVRSMDVLPTVFECAGIEIPHAIQGGSFLPVLSGKGRYDPVIASYSLQEAGRPAAVALFDAGYAYTNFPWRGVPEWLFDESNDPREERNLAPEKPDRAAKLKAQTEEISLKDADFRKKFYPAVAAADVTLDADLAQQLRALGYVR